MTPKALAEALRLRLPNTEIVLGDKPGRVVVKMAPKPYPLTVYIALSKSGDRVEIGDTDPMQRPRDRETPFPLTVGSVVEKIVKIVTDYTTHDAYRFSRDPLVEPRIRAWAHLSDVLPMIRAKVEALLATDQAALAKLRKEVSLHDEDITALERALGVTP